MRETEGRAKKNDVLQCAAYERGGRGISRRSEISRRKPRKLATDRRATTTTGRGGRQDSGVPVPADPEGFQA